MREPIRVLVAEDNVPDAELILRELRRAGFEPQAIRVETEDEFRAHLHDEIDVVLSDYDMPQFSGPRALAVVQEERLDIPFIIISGTIGEEIAVEVMKQGAADYLLKDRLARLGPAVTQALRQSRLRRQAVAELRLSEQRYSQLVQGLPVAVFTTDPEGYLTLFNDAAVRLWGRTPQLGRDRWTGALQLFQPDGAPLPHEECPLARALRDRQAARDVETLAGRPDGSRVAYLSYPTPLLGADGELAGMMNVLVDITARKEAEKAIQERLQLEERLSRLIGTAPGIIYSFRLRPDGTTCMPFASPKLEEILGLHPEEVRSDSAAAFALIHADDLARVLASIRESAQHMTTWNETFRVQHPRRGLLWIEGRSDPTREPDAGVLWHGFLLDVTQRKQLEEQFRQAQKMETVGQLATGMAHDFNNILTIIQGYASLLLSSTMDPREASEEISHAVERASALSRQLLTFSRKQVMQPRDLELNSVIATVAKMLTRTLGEDVILAVELSRDLPAIHADEGMTEQLLLNLAINARHAMPNGGRLTLRTEPATITTADLRAHPETIVGPGVRFSVVDTGCGIEPTILPQIFEPFFTTKAPGHGTGLGLATVHDIVREHRGWLEVASEPGKGTTFAIILPASRGAATAASPAPEAEPIRGSGSILFVDDEPEVRKISTLCLQRLGYTVLEAATGAQALSLFHEHQDAIDLLITDMIMPGGVDGSNLAEMLRAEKPALRVVLTSGYALDGNATGHFLKKPYSVPQLAQTVHDALHS